MSTRCGIAMEQEDGTVEAIYCHNSGYATGVGVILGGWYSTPDLVKELLELGDLSHLGIKIAPETGMNHSFDEPQVDVTVAYHRDRGEPLTKARVYCNKNNLKTHGKKDFTADYLYLYTNGKWLVYGFPNKPDWIELKVIINDMED